MGVAGLNWQTFQIPFSSGLDQRSDDRARQPPALEICKDARFDELGGLQTRYPFAAIGANILGGGTISGARKLEAHGDELLLWTSNTLYTWSAADSAWVSRGTHLAVAIDERERFPSPSDAGQVDRAQLGNRILYTWSDGSHCWAASTDATTGAVVQSPVIVDISSTVGPRVVALTTKWLLFYRGASNKLTVKAIRPTNIATDLAAAGTAVSAVATGVAYDVAQIPGVDSALVAVSFGASYVVYTVTSALAITSSSKARVASAIAIAITPDGVSAEVVRQTSTSTILGDMITVSTMADARVGDALGTVVSGVGGGALHIAAAFSSTFSGSYTCFVFWTDALGAYTKSNTIDNTGAPGSEFILMRQMFVATRAFDVGGSVFVWLGFNGGSNAAGLQNCCLLVRSDGFIAAKALTGVAGGVPPNPSNVALSALPGVQALSSTSFAMATTERRRVTLSIRDDYTRRAPRDVTFSFDANAARRTARLGRTLYIASGEVLQYDGAQMAELGWHIYPWSISAGTATGTGLVAGTYVYQATIRWDNANGERDRSTTVKTSTVVAPSAKSGQVSDVFIYTSKKSSAAFEVWRTAINPTADSPFFLVTGIDPTVVAGSNCYIINDTTLAAVPSFVDAFTDAVLTTREQYSEAVNELPALAPPAGQLIVAHGSRLFLGRVAGDPNRVWYTRQQEAGFVAEFDDQLTADVPVEGGDMTAMAFLDDTLVVFRESAVYQLPGDGIDNVGDGSNYGPARTVSVDVGAVSAESVVVVPEGLLFKSLKGWYILSQGFALTYIGAPVVDYDAETVYAAHVLDAKHQVRILTSGRMLTYDVQAKQWGEYAITDGLDATIWNDTYHYLTATGPKAEQGAFSGLDYGMDVESAWIKLADLQGAGRVRRILINGEYRSAFKLRIRIAYDYKYDGAGNPVYVDDVQWTPSPTTVGSALQVKRGPRFQQCEAIKIRLTAINTTGAGFPTGEALKLTGLALECGIARTLYKRLPAAQKV